jgi:hypothetical protein
MSVPIRDPRQRQLTDDGPRRTLYALPAGTQTPPPATSLPGHLCEVCLDAPAVQLHPAPWGGEMGVCATCQNHDA